MTACHSAIYTTWYWGCMLHGQSTKTFEATLLIRIALEDGLRWRKANLM